MIIDRREIGGHRASIFSPGRHPTVFMLLFVDQLRQSLYEELAVKE